jgi:hypothetical protein
MITIRKTVSRTASPDSTLPFEGAFAHRSAVSRTSARHSSHATASPCRSVISGLALGTALFLAGCSTTSMNRTYLPSGDVGFTINCSGDSSDSNWGECYKKAGEACGNYGYDVISKDQDNGAAGGTLAGVFSANVKNRSLVVKCKQ